LIKQASLLRSLNRIVGRRRGKERGKDKKYRKEISAQDAKGRFIACFTQRRAAIDKDRMSKKVREERAHKKAEHAGSILQKNKGQEAQRHRCGQAHMTEKPQNSIMRVGKRKLVRKNDTGWIEEIGERIRRPGDIARRPRR